MFHSLAQVCYHVEIIIIIAKDLVTFNIRKFKRVGQKVVTLGRWSHFQGGHIPRLYLIAYHSVLSDLTGWAPLQVRLPELPLGSPCTRTHSGSRNQSRRKMASGNQNRNLSVVPFEANEANLVWTRTPLQQQDRGSQQAESSNTDVVLLKEKLAKVFMTEPVVS